MNAGTRSIFTADGAGRAAPDRPLPQAAELTLAGVSLTVLPEGALWWPAERMLVVADLHFEKGSTFARRGQLLPPYDTRDTLAVLGTLVRRLDPRTIVALGDSFHESRGAERLGFADRAALKECQAGRTFVWIAGNHDPEIATFLSGQHCDDLRVGPLHFVHEPLPGAARGQIAGHLHPAARVVGRGGSVRRRCFVSDGQRMVMPALGAYAGGLNVLSRPFAPLFVGTISAYVLGESAVYKVDGARLRPD